MRDNFFYFNAKFYKTGQFIIGPDSRGLRYGDGLFETIKVRQGVILHADEHFARLWQGMSTLGFQPPRHFTPTMLEEAVLALCQKNNHTAAARIRLAVYRGAGGLYDVANHQPNCVIESWPLSEGNGQWNSNGLVLGISDTALKSCDAVANLKHNNYLPYVLAALEAKQQKWNDAVVLNMHRRVCDTTIANIFMVKNETVITPPLAEGCVAGVMRRHLLRLLQQNAIPVQETPITVEALLVADEVFTTNAIYGLRWVQQVATSDYGNALTQKIYGLLQPTI